MCMFDRRLQILIDEPRFRRVATAARLRKTSVSEVIRDAIDQALPADLEKKRAAWEELQKAKPIPLPKTVKELKAEMRESRGRLT
jgi:hypothetical protein